MPYKRENGVYYSDFTSCRTKRRVRRSLGTSDLKQAKVVEVMLIEQDLQLKQNINRRTWADAVTRYYRNVKHKSSIKDIQRHLRYLNNFLGDKYLDEITDDVIDEIIDAKSCEKNKSGEPISGATVNRLTTTLKAVLRKAHEKGWITRIPAIEKFQESSGRVRYLTSDEANLLISECAEHIRPIVIFALHTGLRSSNCLGLRWDHVDLEKGVCWIDGDEHKNGKARNVAFNTVVWDLLKELAINKESSIYVFTYKGRKIGSIKKGFKSACKRAGLSDVTFHTLRHTYATHLAKLNVPTRALVDLGGWSNMEMAKRYSHHSDEDLRRYNELLVNMTQSCTQQPTQRLKLVSG